MSAAALEPRSFLQENTSTTAATQCCPWRSIKTSLRFSPRPRTVKCKSAIPMLLIRRRNDASRRERTAPCRSASFDIDNLKISYEKAGWFEYFKCGIQGIRDQFPQRKLKGMKVLIDGNIPRSAGLSSSSALVVCAALTTCVANGISISKVRSSNLFAEKVNRLIRSA